MAQTAIAARPGLAPAGPDELDALEEALEEAVESAQAAWPDLGIDPLQFVRFLAERLPERADPPSIGRVHASDLLLVCACLAGNARALDTFESRFLRRLGVLVAGLTPSDAEVADLAGQLRQKLLVTDGARRAKLADYSGRGDLEAWLRVVGSRELISMRRARAPELPVEEDFFARLRASGATPEMAHLQETYAGDFREAFQLSLEALSSRQRNLLRYRYLDDMSVDQIGAVYGVHRATAARWVADAEQRLYFGVRDRLRERLRVNAAELDSILALVQSRLDISIRWTLSQTGTRRPPGSTEA